VKKTIVISSLLFVVSVVYLQAKFLHSSFIGFSNYTQIQNNIYLDNEFTQKEIEDIKSLIYNAKKRIETTFGELQSTPTIIVSKTKQHTLKYGNRVGLTYISPIGSFVVIGDKGINIDVIAHELLHAETAYRLGYFTRQFKFPVWIDEGMSMQVDYRKKYIVDTLSSKEIQRVQTLKSVDSFFGHDAKQVIKNYQGAKYVMAKFLQQNPQINVFELLQEFKEGKEIEELFYIKM